MEQQEKNKSSINRTKGIEPMTLDSHEPEWYKEQGYLDIDVDILGEALSYLFTYNLDYPFFYNKIYYELEGQTQDGKTIKDGRHMALVAPKKYAEHVTRPFEKETFIPKTEEDTMLKHQPLRLIDEAYLLRFTNEEDKKIEMGVISNGRFIPGHIFPIRAMENFGEVEYNNPEYSFIQDFFRTVMQYKLDNHKPNINIQDIYNILGTYGIERREYLEKLVRTLQNVRDKAISTATDNKSVGLILSKKSE